VQPTSMKSGAEMIIDRAGHGLAASRAREAPCVPNARGSRRSDRTSLLFAAAVAIVGLTGCAQMPSEPAAPASGARTSAVTTPSATKPARTPVVAAKTTPAPAAPGSRPMTDLITPLPKTVALVLPLTGRVGAAGTALRDGFMTAWYRTDAATRPEIRVYDAGTDAIEAYRRAVAEGAGFIVGPLAKDDVQAVARIADGTVPTLALNALPDGEPTPPRFYQFALAPEDEARQVADRLVAEGRRIGVALVPQDDWGARVVGAFQAELEAGGGAVVSRQTYPAQTMDYSEMITALLGFGESRQRYQRLAATLGTTFEFAPRRRDDVQFVFVAGQPTQGRLIRPQLKFHFAGDLPVYSTSDVFDPNPSANEDLEGVAFPDAPWMVSQDPSIAGIREEAGTTFGVQNVRRRGRLYAMGYDASTLVGALRDPLALSTNGLAGMSGRLTLDPYGRVRRTLEWATIGSDGQPRPLPPPAAAAPVAVPAGGSTGAAPSVTQ
jgi:outer membrane PBP1 activator LpoA protein